MNFKAAVVFSMVGALSFTGCEQLRARAKDSERDRSTEETQRGRESVRQLPELRTEHIEVIRERTRDRSRPAETDLCIKVAALSENLQIADSADIDVILGSWGRVGSAADVNSDNIVDGADLGIGLGCIEGPLPGDFDGDGTVSMTTDFVMLLNFMGFIVSESPEAAPYDLTGDGVVDAADLAVFLGLVS